MTEETFEEMAEEAIEIEAAEKTPEQRQREDYERRLADAIKDREDVFRRNGLLKPNESLTVDVEAAIRLRCCF